MISELYPLLCSSFPSCYRWVSLNEQMLRVLGLAKINTDIRNTEVSGMFLVHFYFSTIKNDELWVNEVLIVIRTNQAISDLIATKPLLIKSTILIPLYHSQMSPFCLVVKDGMNFYSYLSGNSVQWSRAWVLESEGPGSKPGFTITLPVTLDTLSDFFMCETRILPLHLTGFL